MAQIDFAERQLTLKIIYYGPPRSGKTTNLSALYERVDALNRGRLVTLDTKDDRTLFFDLLPIFFRSSALSFRVKVYTVPGQPVHEATRRVVLRQADGIVFVADSLRSQVATNAAAYRNLVENVTKVGLDPAALPVVIQYNKRIAFLYDLIIGNTNIDYGSIYLRNHRAYICFKLCIISALTGTVYHQK